MNVSRPHKILATVAYADIFHYPLTGEEVSYWGVGGIQGKVGHASFLEVKRAGSIQYFFLKGRSRIVSLRTTRANIAIHKWNRINRTMNYFRLIPTLQLVGVTGGLAVCNAKESDDIDVFFIAKKHSMWITRLLVTLLAELLGVRRKPDDGSVADKICLNMFMSDNELELPRTEHDLFAAHEVLQMVPLWEAEETYRKFLLANRWVAVFLPRAYKDKLRRPTHSGLPLRSSIVRNAFSMILVCFEPVARHMQLWYMRKRRTKEVIRSGMIRFHPRDAREWVKEKLQDRLQLYHIPLDKIFYGR